MDIKEIIAQRNSKTDPAIATMMTFFNRNFKEEMQYAVDEAKSEVEKTLDSYKKDTFAVIDKAFNERQKELQNDVGDYFSQFKQTLDSSLSEGLNEVQNRTDKTLEKCYNRMEESTQRIEKIKATKGDKGDTPVKGKDYFDGKDGSPDKPDEVVEKVNTAKKKVFMSSISGLVDELSKIRQAINRGGGGKKGGGGSVGVIHEVKDISSATTTITLQDKPAGNGTAIFGARYQGQVLDLDVHYTVSGKVITLLFTPEDDTKFSISYAR